MDLELNGFIGSAQDVIIGKLILQDAAKDRLLLDHPCKPAILNQYKEQKHTKYKNYENTQNAQNIKRN